MYIGIDYHKRYSVYCVVDNGGEILMRGRIEHARPQEFVELVKRWAGCRVVFEATMNWGWLYEILEQEVEEGNIVLANPYKTRIIAEAQVKTDKVDAHILAQLLRANLVSGSHIASKPTRECKEVLRQRCFFVRQRTMLRNRIHRLLGGQHGLKLPQCSDLFGRKGMVSPVTQSAPPRVTKKCTTLRSQCSSNHPHNRLVSAVLNNIDCKHSVNPG